MRGVTRPMLTISVLTACTGQKVRADSEPLTIDDFSRGRDHVAELHRHRADRLIAAEDLYRGQQHVRLMRGVAAARGAGHNVVVSIASAGYGLVDGREAIVPYECTFQGMSTAERRSWARTLALPEATRALLGRRSDVAIVLLGDDYFDACGMADRLPLGGPMYVVCGANSALRVQPSPHLRTLVLHRDDTRRFACGLVGLKGEVAGRLVALLATSADLAIGMVETDLIDRLAGSPPTAGWQAQAS